MLVFDDVEYFIGANSTKKNVKEISSLASKLEKEVNKKYGREKNKIVKKCMKECIKTHKGKERKTGGLYAKHPLEMSLNSLDYNVDYITLGGILLHDVVEELVDEKVSRFNGNLSKKEKNKLKVELRNNHLVSLSHNFFEFLEKEKLYTPKYSNNTKELISLVSKVSRYKTDKQTYYEYLKNLFSEKFVVGGKKVSKKDIERAIIIKLLDRKNNIESLYDLSEKPKLPSVKTKYKQMIDLYYSNKIKYILFKKRKNEIKLKNSLSGQRKLYGIWKNIYLINQTKNYLDKSRKSPRTKKIDRILDDLIKSTLDETKLNKYLLRLDSDLSNNYSRLIDREILVYDEVGGLEKITQRNEKAIKYEVYRSFDGTVDRYTSMIHEDEKEIKHTGRNKKVQYRDTVAFERILKKQLIDKQYRIKGVDSLN